jgi:RNA polymerase sigma-70 factor, ECF subfamily
MNHLRGSGRQGGMGTEPAARSDEELLRAVADGDTSALRALYERHASWVLVRLARRCADAGLVEEVLQDTFVGVWRNARRYRGTGEVAGWIWGIAIRRLIDALRRRRLPDRLAARLQLGALRMVEPSAEEQVLVGVRYGDLAGALDRLSPELRAVVQATILDGLTTTEAARLLQIPAGTVKTRLMRARAQLRQALA